MIALDSSAVICLIERIEPARTRLVELVRRHAPVLVSTVSIAECLKRPIADQNQPLRDEFAAFFRTPDLRLHDVTASIAQDAASLGAKWRLKSLDAIHLATAIDATVDVFATTDWKDFGPCVGQVPLTIELVVRYPNQQPPPQ